MYGIDFFLMNHPATCGLGRRAMELCTSQRARILNTMVALISSVPNRPVIVDANAHDCVRVADCRDVRPRARNVFSGDGLPEHHPASPCKANPNLNTRSGLKTVF